MPKQHSWAVRSALVAALFLSAASTSGPVLAGQKPEHLRVRVYVIDFDPLIEANRPLTAVQGWNDPFVLQDQYRADIALASGGIVSQRLVRVSTVRGYPAKAGFEFTNATYFGCLADHSPGYCGQLIDYGTVLNTVFDRRVGSACTAIARGRADEIWLWGGPWFGFLEQRLVEPDTLCAGVSRPFEVMGFSYERGEPEMLHDLGHRAEALIQAGIGPSLWDRFDGQRSRYAQDFACPSQPDADHPEVDAAIAHAGNVHFPPNAYCHYQSDRNHPVISDADDWANYPNLTGRTTVVDASTWGATQRGFLVWWLSRMPRHPGSSDGIERDWWRYIYLAPTSPG